MTLLYLPEYLREVGTYITELYMPAYTRGRASERICNTGMAVTNPRKRITKRGKHMVQSNPESLCYIMWGTPPPPPPPPHHRTLPKLWQVRTYIPTYQLGQMKCAVPCFVVVQYLCGSGVGASQPASQRVPAFSEVCVGGWMGSNLPSRKRRPA